MMALDAFPAKDAYDSQATTALEGWQRRKNAAARSAMVWALTLIVVAAGFAWITSGVLARVVGDVTVAYFLGFMFHGFVGLGVHLWQHGCLKLNMAERNWGRIAFLLGLLFVIFVLVTRASLMIDRGISPPAAYGISVAVALLEIGIPSLLGYLVACAWHWKSTSAREWRFWQNFHMKISNAGTADLAETTWIDEVMRLHDEIATRGKTITRLQDELRQSTSDRHGPVKLRIAQEYMELDHLNRRYEQLKTDSPRSTQDVENAIRNRTNARANP